MKKSIVWTLHHLAVSGVSIINLGNRGVKSEGLQCPPKKRNVSFSVKNRNILVFKNPVTSPGLVATPDYVNMLMNEEMNECSK